MPRYRMLAVLVALGLALAARSQSPDTRRPNILILLADDMGYGDIIAMVCPDFKTPAIDSLARNGTRFSSGYVSGPYCSPTRAGLMTGRYQQRFGHEFNPGPAQAADEK